MRIEFKAEELKKAVSRAERFTNPKGYLSEFKYLCFNGSSLMATDGIIGILQTVSVDFGEEPLLIPAELFSKAISSLGDQDVEITVEKKGILLKSGGFKTKFQRLVNPEMFTWTDIPSEEIRSTPTDFMVSLKQVRFSVSTNEQKPGLMGVYFDGLYFYSTDNFRITRMPSVDSLKDTDILFPDTVLSAIVSEGEPNGYCLSGGKIWFYYDDFIVFGRLLEQKFPDCNIAFKELYRGNEVRFDQSILSKALERLAMFKSEGARVDVVVNPDTLILLTTGEGAEAIEKIEAETKASGMFSLNLRYMLDAVNATERFFIPDSKLNPIYFQSQSGLETLVLPIEVGDVETNSISRRVREYLGVEGTEETAETEAPRGEETTEATEEKIPF